jgi:hypothetical protein
MACELFQGNEIGCRDNVGGVKEVYIANLDNVSLPVSVTSGVAATIAMISAADKFYTFQLEKEDTQYDNNMTSSIETGTTFYESTLVFTMKKMSASQKNSIDVLARARLMVIVLDANDQYWVMGTTRGADALTITNGTGKAMGDLNGATVTITGKEPLFDPEYTGTIGDITD